MAYAHYSFNIFGPSDSIEDKLDAYYILALSFHAQRKPKKAYETCLDVLRLLGEMIPSSIEVEQVFSKVYNVQRVLAEMSDADILNLNTMEEDKKKLALVQFYCEIHFSSYFLKTDAGIMVS